MRTTTELCGLVNAIEDEIKKAANRIPYAIVGSRDGPSRCPGADRRLSEAHEHFSEGRRSLRAAVRLLKEADGQVGALEKSIDEGQAGGE